MQEFAECVDRNNWDLSVTLFRVLLSLTGELHPHHLLARGHKIRVCYISAMLTYVR